MTRNEKLTLALWLAAILLAAAGAVWFLKCGPEPTQVINLDGTPYGESQK